MTPVGVGSVVVDTDVFSGVLMEAVPTGDYIRFKALLHGHRLVLAAQTVAEVRAGALQRNWGQRRVSDMEAKLRRLGLLPVDDEVCRCWAELKAECARTGHALGQKEHDGDRWIAATARRYGLLLASNDRIFKGSPGITLLGD